MKVTWKQLSESAGPLQRFGALKFKGRAIGWKASRIYQAAKREIEKIQKAKAEVEDKHEDFVLTYGVELNQQDENGVWKKFHQVRKGSETWPQYKTEAKKLEQDWNELLSQSVEIWGDPFTIDELPDEFWGQVEERDNDGKVIKPSLEPMMTNEDVGGLSDWLFVLNNSAGG